MTPAQLEELLKILEASRPANVPMILSSGTAPTPAQRREYERLKEEATLKGKLKSLVAGALAGIPAGILDVLMLPSMQSELTLSLLSGGKVHDPAAQSLRRLRKEYTEHVTEPVVKRAPSEGWARGGEIAGEFVGPSIAFGPFGRAASAATKGLFAVGEEAPLLTRLAAKTVPRIAGSAAEAAPSVTTVHLGRGEPLTAKGLAEEVGGWVATDLLLGALGRLARSAVGRRAGEAVAREAGEAVAKEVGEATARRGTGGGVDVLREALKDVKVEPAAATEAAAEGAAQTAQAAAKAKLPEGIQLRTQIGNRKVVFSDPVDRALYTVGSKRKSDYHDELMEFLRKHYPDATDEQIIEAGRKVNAHVNSLIKGSKSKKPLRIGSLRGTVDVEVSPAAAREAAAPTAAEEVAEDVKGAVREAVEAPEAPAVDTATRVEELRARLAELDDRIKTLNDRANAVVQRAGGSEELLTPGDRATIAAIRQEQRALERERELVAAELERLEAKLPKQPAAQKTEAPAPKAAPTLEEAISRLSPKRGQIATEVINTYLDSPEVAQEAREALRLWKVYKTSPEVLDPEMREMLARIDAYMGSPRSELEFVRAYKDFVRRSVLRGTRSLPGEYGRLLEVALKGSPDEVRSITTAAQKLERTAASRQEESLRKLRQLAEQRKLQEAERMTSGLHEGDVIESSVGAVEPTPQPLATLEEAELVPEIPRMTELPKPSEILGTAEARVAQAELPKVQAELSKRYVQATYRGNKIKLRFSNNVDRALFEVGRRGGRGEAVKPYMDFLRKKFPNATDEEIIEAGKRAVARVRNTIKRKGPVDPQKPFTIGSLGIRVGRTVSKARAVEPPQVATPAAKVAEDIGAAPGTKVGVDAVASHPSVQAGEATPKQVVEEAVKRGAEIDPDETVKLYSGIAPDSMIDALRNLFKSPTSRQLYKDIRLVNDQSRSLPREILNRLPEDAKVVIDGEERTLREWFDTIDREAGIINNRIHEMEVQYGPRHKMTPEQRADYDAYVERLAELGRMREELRPAVEAAVGEIKSGKFSKDLAYRINKAKLVEGEFVLKDAHGNELAYLYRGPLSGKEYTLQVPKEYLTKDETAILRTTPTLYARYLGLIRDVFGESLAGIARRSFMKMRIFTSEYEKELFNILKPVIKNKEARERITLILEGTPPPDVKPIELEVAEKLRALYDKLFREFDIDPERYLKDYAPRIRKYPTIEEAFQGMENIPEELKFFAELERRAPEPLFPRELDALTAGLAYIRYGARKKFLQPFIEETAPFVSQMNPIRQRMWQEVVDYMLGRPSQQEIMLNKLIEVPIRWVLGEVPPQLRKRYANAISQFVTHMGYMATIGGNLATALKNTTSLALSVGGLSKNPIEGIVYLSKALRALRTEEGREALKYCWVLTARDYLEGVSPLTTELEKLGAAGRLFKLIENASFAPMEITERLNVATSYMMSLLYNLERGVPISEAIEIANTFANSTQFLYGIDSPLLSRTPAGRLVMMLMSWPVNYMRLLYKYGMEKDFVRIANTIFSGIATMYVMQRVTGIDMSSTAPGRAMSDWLPLSFLLSGSKTPPIQLAQDAVNYAKTAYSAVYSPDPDEKEKARRALINDLWSFAPLGIAMKRIVTVAKAMEQGGVMRGPEGQYMYKFGEIRTPEGEVKRLPGPGGWIPEEIRALIGATAEQAERRKIQQEVISRRNRVEELRDIAFKAYLRGDTETLRKAQDEIMRLGGKPLTYGDVNRRLQKMQKESEVTYAERLAEPMVKRGARFDERRPIGERILRSLFGY